MLRIRMEKKETVRENSRMEEPTCTLDSLLLCKLLLGIFQWILRCLRK